MNGKVIGVNSAIFMQSGGNIGIGFAIPINMAKQLRPQLRKGKVSRSRLGVMIQNITPDLKTKLGLGTDEGALVSDVVISHLLWRPHPSARRLGWKSCGITGG
jgi:serine protease Do